MSSGNHVIIAVVVGVTFWWLLTCISALIIAKVRGVKAGYVWLSLAAAALLGPLIGIAVALTLPQPPGADQTNMSKILVALLPALIGFAGAVVSAIAAIV